MKDIALADVRNFVLLGHTQSGKTTLCDALLYKLGLNDKRGSVDAGTSMSDYTEEERNRKISIYAESFSGTYKAADGKQKQIVVTDTPGYADFFGQVLCACRAADAALVTVDAVSGIQVGTVKVWRKCEELGMPRGIVVTGLDRDNTDFNKTLDEIKTAWGKKCVPVVFPLQGADAVADILGKGSIPDSGAEQTQSYKEALIEMAAEKKKIFNDYNKHIDFY